MSGKRRFPVIELNAPVSILMPVSNEIDVIESVITEWADDVLKYLPKGSELFLEDGASTDGTKEKLSELSGKYSFLRVEYKDRKDGFANAARRLYAGARCPLVFFTDSDGQYVAEDFWILARFINDYDIVRGAKVGRKDPFVRRMSSFIFNKAVHFLFTVQYDDVNSAFHLMRKEVVDDILPQLKNMQTLINTEFLLRAELSNYRIKQCYVMHRMRKFGKSRGLPAYRFFFDSLMALQGLFDIKASYRQK